MTDPTSGEQVAQRPIFIVGCPRSGTTLVRWMLDAHRRISCGPETLFLRQIVLAEENSWRRLTRFGITRAEWRDHVRQLFVWVHSQYAVRNGKARWADKSPGYALILDYLDSLFPDCQVVHVIRDPRDVVDSWRRRWGVVSARQVPHAWPQHVTAARAFGAAHGPDRYTEVRYEELVTDPKAVMGSLLDWLGEPWDENVLHFRRDELVDVDGERRLWLGASPDPEEQDRTSPATPGAPARNRTRDPEAREIDHAHPLGVFASSVGVGRRPLNYPYLVHLRLTSGALMRELGYR